MTSTLLQLEVKYQYQLIDEAHSDVHDSKNKELPLPRARIERKHGQALLVERGIKNPEVKPALRVGRQPWLAPGASHVKYVPGVLEAAYGVFGIAGGPVLGAFSLGMFFPFVNRIGAVAGLTTSLILIMWIGFGQTVSQQMGTYGSTGNWAPKMPTSIENCTAAFVEAIPPPAAAKHASDSEFPHIPVYEVSYMWFSLIASVTCVLVGVMVSLLTGVSDHRYVRRDCICMRVPDLFARAPSVIRHRVVQYWSEIGANLSSDVKSKVVPSVTIKQIDDLRASSWDDLSLAKPGSPASSGWAF